MFYYKEKKEYTAFCFWRVTFLKIQRFLTPIVLLNNNSFGIVFLQRTLQFISEFHLNISQAAIKEEV